MNRVIVRDNGARKRLLNLARPAHVSLGVHADDGSEVYGEGGEITIADIAGIHEFGLGVPERSWLRDFVDENRADILARLRQIAKNIARGEDPDREMERFGLVMVGMIKERIIDGIEPDILDETKKRKRQIAGGKPKDTPLILFGQFISSIAHRVERTAI